MNKWLDICVNAYIDNFGKTEKPIVWDVGSRDGDDGAELFNRISGINPDENLVLIEASPIQAELCRTNYPRAITIECAIDEKNGVRKFLSVYNPNNIEASGTSSLNTLHKETKHPDAQLETINVETRRLDSLIPKNQAIDIMKIDIEQYSWQALQSLGDRLKDVKVFHIETETDLIKDVMHPDWHNNIEIREFMEDNGFIFVGKDNEWGEGIEDQVYVNGALL